LARYTAGFGESLKGLVGSSYYVAPQVIAGNYTYKCDIWSCGVVAYALLSGFAPFDASTDKQVLELVSDGRFDFDDPEWDHVSELAKDFIAQLLEYDEEHRPSAFEALQHPWLKIIRKSSRMNNALVRTNSRNSLRNLSKFESKSNKLKQAACAIIASQLLTNEEKALVDDAFRALDKTCSGQISKKDLNSSFASLFRDDDHDESARDDDSRASSNESEASRSSHAELIDNIFEQVNFSGSGAIQYSEFSVVMILEKNMVTDDKLRAAFKFFDRQDKGYIAVEDLGPILKLGNRACNRVMKENAGNCAKDQISFEDFKKCVLPERKKKPAEEEELAPLGLKMHKFKGPLGGPMDDSSLHNHPSYMDESSNRRPDGRHLDESSRRHPLVRSRRASVSATTRIDKTKVGNLRKLHE
jgi:calcium-dependent protein kinase